MNRRLVGFLVLLVFAFGLIPGEYWKILHHHKHYSAVASHTVGFSEKHKTCTNNSHLYDFTKTELPKTQLRVDIISPHPVLNENHIPHPAFLNSFLRAPPALA